MKQKFSLESIRGSLFIPFTPFGWHIINELLQVLKDYIPSQIEGSPWAITPKIIVPPGCWVMSSPDKNKWLLVLPEKVDFIILYKGNQTDNQLNESILFIKQVMTLFMSHCNCDASRLAIAPSFVYNGNDEEMKTYINKMYCLNEFDGSNVDNCDFSQVFRVKRQLGEKYFTMNYLSHFYTEGKVTLKGGVNTIDKVTLVDFDINTFVDPNYTFDKKTVEIFFDNSAKYCEEFMTFYFEQP